MNSLQDLNAWGNTAITFIDQSEYSADYTQTGGNVTLFVNEEADPFTLPKQVTVANVVSTLQDIIIRFEANNTTSIDSISYQGNYGNMAFTQTSANTWIWQGIRTEDQYDEAWANTVIQLGIDQSQDFIITNTVADGFGNNFNWTTTVEITDLPEVQLPSNIEVTAGQGAQSISNFEIIDNSGLDYVVEILPGPAYGNAPGELNAGYTGDLSGNLVIGLWETTGISATDTISFSGNKAEVNALFNALTFNPITDLAGTVLVNITRSDGETLSDEMSLPVYVRPDGIGSFWRGGYYAGAMSYDGNGIATHHIILEPKTGRENNVTPGSWISLGSGYTPIGGSLIDGYTNTQNLVSAFTSQEMTDLHSIVNFPINDYNDWYLPARYELEQMYFVFKPHTFVNDTTTGANPYSVPIRNNYQTQVPAQNTDVIWQTGGSQSLFWNNDAPRLGYWSSTDDNTSQNGPDQLLVLAGFDIGGSMNEFSQAYQNQTGFWRAVRKLPYF